MAPTTQCLLIIHYIPDWRSAVAETARVLKLGQLFVFEEVTTHVLGRPSYRPLFDQPREGRFLAGELLAELPRHGLGVRASPLVRREYLLGAATRSG